jgi:hypothetical protein
MAAQYGQATFVTVMRRIPVTIPVQFYLDDAAGNPVKFDVGGGDASKGSDRFVAPEAVKLVDFCIAAASGQTRTSFNKDGSRIATILNAAYLASVTFRPPLAITLAPGQALTANQVA